MTRLREDATPGAARQKKPPRPASTYRGARRNYLKAGGKPRPHRWQTRPDYFNKKTSAFSTPVLPDNTLDYTFKGQVRANERKR